MHSLLFLPFDLSQICGRLFFNCYYFKRTQTHIFTTTHNLLSLFSVIWVCVISELMTGERFHCCEKLFLFSSFFMNDVVVCLGMGTVKIFPSMIARLLALFLFRSAGNYIVEVSWVFKSFILIVYFIFLKNVISVTVILVTFFCWCCCYCNQKPDKM